MGIVKDTPHNLLDVSASCFVQYLGMYIPGLVVVIQFHIFWEKPGKDYLTVLLGRDPCICVIAFMYPGIEVSSVLFWQSHCIVMPQCNFFPQSTSMVLSLQRVVRRWLTCSAQTYFIPKLSTINMKCISQRYVYNVQTSVEAKQS